MTKRTIWGPVEPAPYPLVALAALVAAPAVEEQDSGVRLCHLRRPKHAGHRVLMTAHEERPLGAACASFFPYPLDMASRICHLISPCSVLLLV